jgi:hypothetical protein
MGGGEPESAASPRPPHRIGERPAPGHDQEPPPPRLARQVAHDSGERRR